METITPEKAIVIDAPPGSILVFIVKRGTPDEEVARLGAGLVRTLPQCQIIVASDIEDIRVLAPSESIL